MQSIRMHSLAYLFASVHEPHNLSPRKVALSGPQYISDNFNLTWTVATVANL